MAKRSKKKKVIYHHASTEASDSKAIFSRVWIPLLLAAVTFLVYWPSLKSDFVYDARREILEEGFITSLSNLPDVLSLKIVGTHLMLKDRPGQMLYLMFNAAIWGKEPFGYHLSSNLLQAADVALLFVLLNRLIAMEMAGMARSDVWKAQFAATVAALIFALHPIAVESVAEVSYCASLLVTFLALLALLMATYFRPGNLRVALLTGGVGTLCAFAAVTSKESGVAVAPLLIVYWFLFRRREAKKPWLLFLGAATAVTAAFMIALFLLSAPVQGRVDYLGGFYSRIFLVQPRLWVFMMGQLLWPLQLSADYIPVETLGPSTPAAWAILVVVILLQSWLACRSRMGALGAAIYWLGLAASSNLVPLFRPVADRFYHLPLAGMAMQLFALLLLALKSHRGFWLTIVPCLGALLPLTFLTVTREAVFANEFSLWSATIKTNPLSSSAYNGLGHVFFQEGKIDDAILQFRKALEIDPTYLTVHCNLGLALMQKGEVDEAMTQYQEALQINPDHVSARYDLGLALMQKGQLDEAMVQFQKALKITPNDSEIHYNFGVALMQKGQMDEAMGQFRKVVEIDPRMAAAYDNLGNIFFQKGQLDEAMSQFQKVVEIDPSIAEAHNNLGAVLIQKGERNEALAQFQEAVRLKPGYGDAQNNLAKIKAMLRQGAINK